MHNNLTTTQRYLQLSKRNGICIELTPTQFDYLYETIMFAYEMEVPEQKGWDIQTYDNLVDAVLTNGNVIGE